MARFIKLPDNPTLLVVADEGVKQGLKWFAGMLSSGQEVYFQFPVELDNPRAPCLSHDLLGMTEEQAWEYLPKYPYAFNSSKRRKIHIVESLLQQKTAA